VRVGRWLSVFAEALGFRKPSRMLLSVRCR
jgi:hypothetical protein